MPDLSGKIALVTGASRGIGYHAALALAKKGAHVIAAARTIGGLEDLDDAIKAVNGSATLVPIDLTDLDAIDRLGLSIHERWKRLDVMVGNAGILGGLSPIEHIDPRTFQKVFTLNVTASWRLMRAMSLLLRQADAGRVIFMTSDTSQHNKPFWGAYAASHAALTSLVKTWAAETSKTTMRVNLLDPGAMATALRAEAMPGENRANLAHPGEISESLLKLCREDLVDTGTLFSR